MAGEESSDPDQIHVFRHDGMLNHKTGHGVFDSGVDPGFLDVLENYPENVDRVRNMVSILRRGPISPFISWHLVGPLPAPNCSLSTLKAYRDGVKELCSGTFLNPGSWEAALMAAGTALSATKHILDGHGNKAYVLVRPPGHHAQPTQVDVYCFLNNVDLAVN